MTKKKETKAQALGRIFKKVNYSVDGCWNWLGALHVYGTVVLWGKQKVAHRAMWELLNGKIRTGLVLDHLCENQACVNVQHLEEVTKSENGIRSNRHSVNGLELELMNLRRKYIAERELISRKYRNGGLSQ